MTTRMVEHNAHTDHLLGYSVDMGTTDMSLVRLILETEDEMRSKLTDWKNEHGTFSKVKLHSFLEVACSLPTELLHPFGVEGTRAHFHNLALYNVIQHTYGRSTKQGERRGIIEKAPAPTLSGGRFYGWFCIIRNHR